MLILAEHDEWPYEHLHSRKSCTLQQTVQSPHLGRCLACAPACGCVSACSPWSRASRSCSGPCSRSVLRGPVAGQDPEQDRPQPIADRRPQGPRAGADERHRRPDAPHRRLEGDITRLSTRQQKLQTSLDRKRAELAIVQRRLREERARLTRLRARLLVVRRALAAAARRALQGRRAGRDHGRARVRGLRRPAHPHRVHGARLAPGREDHEHRRRRQGRRGRHVQAPGQAREARGTGGQADRVRARRGLDDPRRARRSPRPHPAPRARTSSRCCASSRDRRHELQDDVEQLQAQQAKIQAKLAGFSGPSTAGPIKAGSSGMIWPVNGPITSPFCESRSWESCHPGIDIGVPTGTPIRAALVGQGRPAAGRGRLGRLRQLHLHPARRRALDLLRAPGRASGPRMGAQVSQGPGDRLRRLHGPLLRRRTCTSRPASTGPSCEPHELTLS